MEDQYGQVGQINRFKEVFKYYKSRRPAPCLDQVLDLRNPEHGGHFTPLDLQHGGGGGGAGLRPVSEWRGVGVEGVPGLAVVAGVLGEEEQVEWASACLAQYSGLGRRNIDALGEVGEGEWWGRCEQEGELVDRLRWVTLGYHHDWDTKEYSEEARDPLPPALASLAAEVMSAMGRRGYRAEAAIVNYFPTSAIPSPHTDHSERDLSQPLVSVSLGLSAVFLLGGGPPWPRPSPRSS